MAKVEASIVVNRTVSEVFQFLSVNENALQWQPGLLEARITHDVQGLGRAWVDVVQFLGRRMEVPFQLTDWQRDQKIAFKSMGGPIPMQGSYAFEPGGAGTQVTFWLTGEPGGFFKFTEPVLMQILQRQWQTNLANLKDVLEAQG
jgi:carbon monoxide dehydrogenase subunit G